MKAAGKSQHQEFIYIDSQPELEKMVLTAAGEKRLALDTEGDSLYHYYDKVCLIQLSFARKCYLIDPLADLDLGSLLKLLSSIPLVLHGGEFDLRMLRQCYGFGPPREVFDTMLAAQVLGREQLGLAALAKEIADVELPKQGKKSNWSKRPLAPDQLTYAANDTRYLFKIADYLSGKLERLDRSEWQRQACEAMIQSTLADKEPRDPDREWRIKGSARSTGRELALIKAIWYFRDKEARKADRPPFKILGNHVILLLADSLKTQQAKDFSINLRLPRNFDGSHVKELREAIRAALSIPESKLPQLIRGKTAPPPLPEADRLRVECSRLADQLNLPASVLASRATLETIVRNRATTVKAMMTCCKIQRWQAELIEPIVKSVLA